MEFLEDIKESYIILRENNHKNKNFNFSLPVLWSRVENVA